MKLVAELCSVDKCPKSPRCLMYNLSAVAIMASVALVALEGRSGGADDNFPAAAASLF